MKKASYIYSKSRPSSPHQVWYYSEDGKRKMKSFAEKSVAMQFLSKCNEELKTVLPEQLVFSVSERILFAQVKEICARADAPLENIIDIIREHIGGTVQKGFTVLDVDGERGALTLFLEDCQKRGGRAHTIKNYKQRIARWQALTNVENVSECTQKAAERYLASIKSPDHAKRALGAFFNFCVARGWIAQNPFSLAKISRRLKEKELPHVLTPADVRELLVKSPKIWQPAIALMAFCGVRPNEIIPLEKSVMLVSDVNFAKRSITIRAEVAKTRTARVFNPPDNVWAWLMPLKDRKKNENIAAGSYEVWRGIKEHSGVEVLKDALRHSFASYGYHFLGAEHTVEIMGHVGGFGMFAKHYKGLADKKSATEYFSIAP